MKANEIQRGTQLFFPNALVGKVQSYTVEDVREDKDDAKLRILHLGRTDKSSDKIVFHASVWEDMDNKPSDHIDLFMPLYPEFGYGGKLVFYYTERVAATKK